MSQLLKFIITLKFIYIKVTKIHNNFRIHSITIMYILYYLYIRIQKINEDKKFDNEKKSYKNQNFLKSFNFTYLITRMTFIILINIKIKQKIIHIIITIAFKNISTNCKTLL